VNRSWVGPLITVAILGGIALILLANLEPGHSRPKAPPKPPTTRGEQASPPRIAGSFREYPIGEPVETHYLRVSAVWLPSVAVEGLKLVKGSDMIHLEADVHATEGNPNGFAKDEFVPYLKIHYRILPEGGQGAPLDEGPLYPMVAKDGLHYGANVSLPKAGSYRLIYHVEPPSAGGLGRHHDPITGVAPWWEPFDVEFAWEYPGPPRSNGS
jgi:uncharacterized protein involved in high-affinity Fe2+ transport